MIPKSEIENIIDDFEGLCSSLTKRVEKFLKVRYDMDASVDTSEFYVFCGKLHIHYQDHSSYDDRCIDTDLPEFLYEDDWEKILDQEAHEKQLKLLQKDKLAAETQEKLEYEQYLKLKEKFGDAN